MNGIRPPKGETYQKFKTQIKQSRARNVPRVIQQDGSLHGCHDIPYNRFIERIDSEAFQEALGMQKAIRYQMALKRILNHNVILSRGGRARSFVSTILKEEGITLQEAVEVYGRWMLAKATQVAVYRAPQIMNDIADDASNKQVVCPRCDGLGTLDVDLGESQKKKAKATIRTCPECKGIGTITQSGDSESRRIILEVAGLAGKRGPLVDARSVHLSGGGHVNVESLVKDMETGEDVPMIAAPQEEEIDIIEAEVDDATKNG